MAVTTAELTRVDTAIERGTRRLLELQRPDGVWVGELESNVTMTAQHLFWHHYLGLRTPELDRRIANDLLARMREDGTWSIWFEGPADLSTTIEAYVACRLAGVDLTAIGARPGQTRPPRRPNRLRRRAVAVAERWIRERQEADGSWGGIQPPWVWGIIALAALGNGLDDPTLAKAVEGWQGFMVEDGERLRPEACQSPIWDTALAALALRACGLASDHEALVKAGDYLLREEVTVKGDWAIRKPGLPP